MKKIIAILTGLVLMLAAFGAGAEAAADPLHEHLAKLGETPYVIRNLEYGELEPGDTDPADFVALLNEMTVEPATAETPDGEYIVLAFPEEGIRFDFFEANPQENLFRLVNKDGSEQLFKATPADGLADIHGVMFAWMYALADAHGLTEEIEAQMPEEGWVRDSVMGQIWMDDRASLEIFLEDESNFKVLISWAGSAEETVEWTYACTYDENDQTLHAVTLVQDNVKYDEQGEEDRTTVKEEMSDAVFSLNAEDRVVITNAGDEQLEGKTFGRVPMEPEV